LIVGKISDKEATMSKRVIFLVTIMAILSIGVYGQSGKKFYKAGNEFMDNMKYEDAVAQYTAAIGVEPSNEDFYIARGNAYLALLKYNDAKADFEKAIVFDPKNIDAYINLGAVLNKMENYEEALSALNHATGLDKRNSNVYREKVNTLIGLHKYEQALRASDTAILIKDIPMDYYYRGIIYEKLVNDPFAKKEFEKSISKDKKLPEPRLALAALLLRNRDAQGALDQCNEVLKNNDRNTDAYLMRSNVYKKNLDYPNAINDISKDILIDPENAYFYFERGKCYQEFNQHTNAINDFTKYISLKPDSASGYAARAMSYEGIMNYDKAIQDYNKITELSEFDMRARKLLKAAQERLYELNRETVPPEISVLNPVPAKDTVEIKGDKLTVLISGTLKDKSKIKSFSINNEPVPLTEKNGEYEFIANVNVNGLNKISISATDDYNNEKVLNYSIKRTEINKPEIKIIAPYADNGQVFLDTQTPNVAIQGKISDQSLIKSITIGDVTASYNSRDLNPSFTAIINVSNINKFTVVAEDIYGNRQESEYSLNREGAQISANNPMGKTWVVFIENSSYESFAALDGPIKDVSTIQRALANYQIDRIIHKKDMTKEEMERYFNIELRDEVKANRVKSLLIWYAGHGKFINDVGYWIPVDAKRDDEFTYFNINGLKAGLQGYSDVVVHTLVVSDACESGPGFYTAMRSAEDAPTCDNTLVAGAKSAQVFTSANQELASDNSLFTATFANTLINNRNACIPIETIVKRVTEAVTDKGQKPKFGTIVGLEDMNGTFFFIAK
jgi:tetratricopeptide (TPR) repeat protein